MGWYALKFLCFFPWDFFYSQKQPIHARAYINFNRSEDVIDFAEFFDGHVFVNEKGNESFLFNMIHVAWIM